MHFILHWLILHPLACYLTQACSITTASTVGPTLRGSIATQRDCHLSDYLKIPTKKVMLNQHIHHFRFQNGRLLEQQTHTEIHYVYTVCAQCLQTEFFFFCKERE